MLTPPENFQTLPKNLDPSRRNTNNPPEKFQPPKHAFLNPPPRKYVNNYLDWLALHLKFGSVYFQQFGGISRHHVDQLQI